MAAPGRRPDLYSPEGKGLLLTQTLGNMGESMFDSEVVPSSLVDITPILHIADEVEKSNPRVAYLCRFCAFEKVHRLFPTAGSLGVRHYKTALLRRLERENVPTLEGRVRKSDAKEMQHFYLEYYRKYIQALQNATDTPSGEMPTKLYQTTAVLFEVLKAVNVTQSVKVDQAVLDAHNTIEEKKKLYVPNNILPLDPGSTDDHAIMQYLESTEVKEGHMFNSKGGKVIDEVNLMAAYEPEKYQVGLLLDCQEEAVSKSGSKPSLPLQYLRDITNNFSDERILGKGGFGVVYKGLLQNGEMVAVKKILQAIPSSQTQFENEVNLLMKLKHRNIVRLIGYCYETRHLHMPYEGKHVFAWNTESLLCLECLPNGSLDQYISVPSRAF